MNRGPGCRCYGCSMSTAHLHSREPERAFNRSHTWNTAVYIETHSDTLEIYSNKFETLLFLLVIDGDTAEPQAAPGVPFKGAFIPTSTTNLMLQPMIELRTPRKQCRLSITGPNLQTTCETKELLAKSLVDKNICGSLDLIGQFHMLHLHEMIRHAGQFPT